MEDYNYDSGYEYYYDNLTDNETHFFTESTEVCPSSYLHGADIYLPILYSIIFLTGFIGNLFVITVVAAKGKRNGRLVDIFVVNLALADLVFVFTLPLWAVSASQSGRWNFGLIGDVLCKLSSYAIAVNRFSNIFFLTCMSVDRYLAVVKLMDSRFLRSSQCIRVTCAVVWLVSLVLGIPSLVYRKVEDNGNGPICLEETQSLFFLGLSLTTVILTFVLPVLIIILCYGTIITHLQKHCAVAGNSRADARRRHSLKMVLFIIVAFIVSWLPFNIFKTIIISSRLSAAVLSCYSLSWQRDGLIISCCLAFLNSCVNPVIYFFFDHHFRRHAKNLYLSCLAKPLLLQSQNSSASFSNIGTSEGSWTTVFRGRLQSFDQKN